jgi:Putative transposase
MWITLVSPREPLQEHGALCGPGVLAPRAAAYVVPWGPGATVAAELPQQPAANSGGLHARLDDIRAFKAYLAPLRKIDWVAYAKRPFGGPRAVLAYLSRYTHRVAISNRRLIAADDGGVSFRWKDYRIEGPGRWKAMTLTPHEFIRRFLMHVLPCGFHRIRHYGLLASGTRAVNIARAPTPVPEAIGIDTS